MKIESQEEQIARLALEQRHSEVLNTEQATEKYQFLSFSAPYVIAIEKTTGIKGSLAFTHMPRFYYNWTPE